MGRAPWQNPKVVLTLCLVFLSGAAAGSLATKAMVPKERHITGPYWNEGGREVALQRFTRELSLTPTQAHEMETVLDDFMMYYQTVQAQMEDVRSTGKQRIMKILNDGQKQKFDKMLGDIQSKPSR